MRESSVFKSCLCMSCPFFCLSSTSWWWCMWITVALVDVNRNTTPVHNSLVWWKLQRASNPLFLLLVGAFWQQCPRWRSAAVRTESDGGAEVGSLLHFRIGNGRVASDVWCFFSRMRLLEWPYVTHSQKWRSVLVVFWNNILSVTDQALSDEVTPDK